MIYTAEGLFHTSSVSSLIVKNKYIYMVENLYFKLSIKKYVNLPKKV